MTQKAASVPPLHREPCLRHNKLNGFTLIEMLISMLIFSMSIAVMSSALFQTGKVLAIVEKGDSSLIKQWRIFKSLEEAIANLTVDTNTQNVEQTQLQGSATQFAGATYRHPFGPQGQVLTLKVSLRNLQDGTTALEAFDSTQRSVLVGVVYGDLEFAYQDSTGKLHDHWPVAGLENEVLPRAIALRKPTRAELLAWWPYLGRNFADQMRPANAQAFFQTGDAVE